MVIIIIIVVENRVSDWQIVIKKEIVFVLMAFCFVLSKEIEKLEPFYWNARYTNNQFNWCTSMSICMCVCVWEGSGYQLHFIADSNLSSTDHIVRLQWMQFKTLRIFSCLLREQSLTLSSYIYCIYLSPSNSLPSPPPLPPSLSFILLQYDK